MLYNIGRLCTKKAKRSLKRNINIVEQNYRCVSLYLRKINMFSK